MLRWPTFWEVFWFSALFVAPAFTWLIAFLLGRWFGLPSWAVAISPLAGLALLYAVVGVLVHIDDKRQLSDAERDRAKDKDRL